MAVQPQGFPNKGIKLSNQKIGQVKGREFIAFCEIVIAFEKGIAMRPAQHFHVQPITGRLQEATRATIRIKDIDIVIGRTMFCDLFLNKGGDFFGCIVQNRGQAF